MPPTIKLNNGHKMPSIGLGTYCGPHAPQQVYEVSKFALETEEVLGKAVPESNVPREELFITTKLYQSFHEPEQVIPAFEMSLKNLGMDYVDLYLMHWLITWKFAGYGFNDWKSLQDENGHIEPIDISFVDTWREMEKLVKDGRAKSIGVPNFTIPMLEELFANCEIPPAVNQIEIHPSLPQEDMLQWCKEHNIVLTGYSPIANPAHRGEQRSMLQQPAVLEAAKKYKTPVQVLLDWGIARGYSVIPKSATPERIKANFVHFDMDEEDVNRIAAIGSENPLRVW